jgi:A/G-specific adenine glycosylase
MSIPGKKIAFFETTLLDFFQKVGREHLPWRKPRKTSSRGEGFVTAYEVWVSEIMLQQTQVSRVIDYYVRFLKKYPTVRSLAKSSWEEFLPYYEGLGYYARGRNMLRAAKIIVAEYDGEFPRDRKLLETIPGIGPYTASAIMSFAHGENHIAWDTNVKRVIGRFFFGTKSYFSVIPGLTRESETLLKKKNPGSRVKPGMTMAGFEKKFSLPAKTLNAALMDFGSALCLARPRCEACSLQSKCKYYKERGSLEAGLIPKPKIPVRPKDGKNPKSKVGWKESRAVVFLHENHQRYFSASAKKYAPFTLPEGVVSRADIKDWFMKKYGLSVSVRPPHGKVVSGGKRRVLVNAQILSGDHPFACFSKSVREEYTERSIA